MMHIFAHHQIFTWHSWTNNGCIFKKSKSGNIWNHQSYHSLSNRIHSAPPQLLQDLLHKYNHFASHIRTYNNALALASIGTQGPPEIGPSYKIQGKLHHSIGPIL